MIWNVWWIVYSSFSLNTSWVSSILLLMRFRSLIIYILTVRRARSFFRLWREIHHISSTKSQLLLIRVSFKILKAFFEFNLSVCDLEIASDLLFSLSQSSDHRVTLRWVSVTSKCLSLKVIFSSFFLLCTVTTILFDTEFNHCFSSESFYLYFLLERDLSF